MIKNLLTLVASSTSLATILFMANAANAAPLATLEVNIDLALV